MSAGKDSDIDQQLERLQEQAGELIKPCRFASSSQLYGELRRRAKAEQRAYPYVMGTFFQMDQAQYLLDFQKMRERAVELIALLEDEERLRQIQADFPVEHYEHLVYSMSACAYENLAEATGQLEGYNSEGMHACISDGIQICRRTGKLGCVGCFREYACDVYLAADDPEIAMHQCRLVTENSGEWSDRGDRRWVASGKAAWLEALHGRFAAAIDLYRQALDFTNAESVSLKTEARLRTLFQLDSVLLAAGREPQLPDDPVSAELPPVGECPLFDLYADWNTALQAVQQQNWNDASQRLTAWDQRLQKCGGTHLWFETRLRLIALKRLSGQQKQAEALARQLEQRARQAHDWLTLHRLDSLLSAAVPSPLATISTETASAARGPAGAATAAAAVSSAATDTTAASATTEADDTEPADTATPLAAVIDELRQRMNDLMQDPSEDKFLAIRRDILAMDAGIATHYDDVASLIHMMLWLVGSGEDGEEVWKWANSLAAAHRNQGLVLSVLGALGDALRHSANSELAEKITAERTEQLFRRSLELDGSRARNHMRAGDHFLRENNAGEAERCFARAFRLDRTLPDVVERLADLYGDTDRPRDALHVLDLSLREGCTEPRVAFNAAMIAFRLKQFDATLTYLDRFETLGGENPAWVCYYRAVCHYELGHFQQALDYMDAAEQAADGTGWHLEAIRGAARAQLGQTDAALEHIEYVLSTPLYEIDFLSPMGIASLLERLLSVATEVLQDQGLQEQLENRLLRSGLMPEWWFQARREGGDPVEGIQLYRCVLIQPLDDAWQQDPERLDNEADWPAYGIEWGVLAASEEDAARMALNWQARLHHLPAELQDTLPGQDTYTDVPGVVWQSSRFPVSDSEDTDELFEDADPDIDDRSRFRGSPDLRDAEDFTDTDDFGEADDFDESDDFEDRGDEHESDDRPPF